jgi:hypothetical protein
MMKIVILQHLPFNPGLTFNTFECLFNSTLTIELINFVRTYKRKLRLFVFLFAHHDLVSFRNNLKKKFENISVHNLFRKFKLYDQL